MSLDLSNFKTVFEDDFGDDTSLSGILWADRWGNPDQYSFANGALTLTSTAAEGWPTVGFMQAPVGKSAGEGYGLYQFTGYANAGQGIGIAFLMWRADNLQIDPSSPGAATEIDILESWDGTKTGQSTVHYYLGNTALTPNHNNDGQIYNQLNINLTQSHTYAMDWERGSLTFYVDGTQIYQDTVNAPLDYADGGSNEVMGAELVNMTSLVTTSTVQLHITSMSYSAPITSTVPVAPVSPTATGVISLQAGQSYVASVGDTVIAGSGPDTVTATAGQVYVTGNSGALTFFGGTGASTVDGGTGSATILGGSGGGAFTGGNRGGNILVSQGASGSNTTLTGGGAGDALFGSAAGNDTLIARVGRESILGGGGVTNIVGGATAAGVIFTGSGPTTVTGGEAGGDTIVGGAGGLSVDAQKGDAIFGNGGSLSVNASTTGADSIIGGSGTLSVNGRGGNMLVVASKSDSNIQTGNGAALVFGSSGDAAVTGGNGWMGVVLGSGKMDVQEKGGTTVYDVVKGSAGGTDMLYGFNVKTDTISLFGYQSSDIHVTSGGGSTLLSLSDGTKIELVGVSNPGHSII